MRRDGASLIARLGDLCGRRRLGPKRGAGKLGPHAVRYPFGNFGMADDISNQRNQEKQRQSDELDAPALVDVRFALPGLFEWTVHGRLHYAGTIPRPFAYRNAQDSAVKCFTGPSNSPSCEGLTPE